MCVELFKQLEDFKIFEVEKDVFIGKIKSLEDGLMNSILPLDRPFNSVLSIGSIAFVSHAMPAHRTIDVNPWDRTPLNPQSN
jgi:hypothetical protein